MPGPDALAGLDVRAARHLLDVVAALQPASDAPLPRAQALPREAATGLPDFGLVGNFNYTPVRLSTWAPAVLVEQAFVSHPGDEAQLLDPAFRARLAQAVRAGLEDFLRTR